MRKLLQSMVVAAVGGCLLVLVTGSPWPGPLTPPVLAATEPQGPAFSAPPGSIPLLSTPTLATPAPTRTPEPGGKPSIQAPEDERKEPPVILERWDARPPHRPARTATDVRAAPRPVGVPEPLASSVVSTTHRIEAGDTVYHLAAQYGTSLETILQANGLDQEGARYLDIGQELVIPLGPAVGEGQAPPAAPTLVHEVQAGEALITIARDYGTTVESIAAANALGDSELILAGQELIVPLPPGSSGAPVARAAGAPAPAEPVTGTELLTQTGPLTAPLVAPAAPISPTAPLTETQGAGPQMTATQAISAAGLLTHTAAITSAVPTAPLTATAGIEEPATTEPLTDTAQAEVSPELAALEEAMVAAVNAEREAHGLSAYRVDDTLSSVARAHAQDMVARDYVGHTSPEGKRVGDRLRDAGMGLDRVGENYYVTTRPAEEAVAYTLAWFMGDPPHRNNILHDYYTRIGVGVAYGPPGWYIFVLDFTGD